MMSSFHCFAIDAGRIAENVKCATTQARAFCAVARFCAAHEKTCRRVKSGRFSNSQLLYV